ncbi:hypothetical protein N2152v2_003443 [Parachlorella kessleri]
MAVLNESGLRTVDFSEVHAYEARMAFLRNISRGEAAVDLADAALQIAAEDDALVSHSSVKLPVEAFHSRLERLAEEVAELRLRPLLARGAGDVELLEAVQQYVLRDKGFRPTAFGRSNVPGHSLVESPGVWEDARNAYLNEVLIRRQGIPAILLILVADLLKRLLQKGVIDFVARQDVSDLGAMPQGELLWGLGRTAVLASDGTVLNTCSSDTLVEVLRFLKRAYWPFPWDSRSGGFVGAAEAAVEGQQSSAELEAIARTAQHRLERGIWTSPGAGDLRRAVAATERLVLLCGERYPKERRDLAVLYLHCGRREQARVELEHFAKRATKEQENAPLWQSLHDQTLVDKLLQAVRAATPLERQEGSLGSPGSSGSSSSAPCSSTVQLLTLESALRQPPPRADEGRRLPLTW